MGRAGLLAALFVGGAIFTGTADAQQPPHGFYLGGGVSWANVSVENDDYYGDCCYYYGYDYDDGEEDVGFSIHAGYRFLPWFAAELGYLDAGKPQWDHRDVYVPDLEDYADTEVSLDAQAAQLSGVFIWPFAAAWELYARAGVSFWWADAEQTAYPYHEDAYYTRRVDDDGAAFLFGIGIGASPAPDWHIRLEFQSFPIDEQLLVQDGDTTIDTLLLELQYRMGH